MRKNLPLSLAILLAFCFHSFLHAQQLEWVHAFGSSTGSEEIADITFDPQGNMCVIGNFEGTVDFDPGPDTLALTSSSLSDIFIGKFDSSGSPIWVKAIGGSSDKGQAIATDAEGNIYTTGFFGGFGDFDPGPATFIIQAGSRDAFISKLDTAGNFVWAAAVGGPSNDEAYDICVDHNSNVLITGSFYNTADFDPGTGVSNITARSAQDVFILKLDSGGNFIWANNFPGTGTEEGLSITSDPTGNIYTAGYYWAGTTDFDPGLDTFELSTFGGQDAFVSKLDSAGTFIWAKSIGGNGTQAAFDIELDGVGNIYLAGGFNGTADFDPGNDTLNISGSGFSDAFVTKWDASGNVLWAEAVAGTGFNRANKVRIDSLNNVIISGFFEEGVDLGQGAVNLNSAGGSDAFIASYNSGGALSWAGAISGPDDNTGLALAISPEGYIYAGGYFEGTANFNPMSGTNSLSSLGSRDAYLMKISELSTGIDIKRSDVGMKVYPNPGSQTLYIDVDQSTGSNITITDLRGKIWLAGTLSGRNTELDISEIPSGLYILNIFDSSLNYKYKLLIE